MQPNNEQGRVRIIGIDPGTTRLGFAVIEKASRGAALIEAGVIGAPRLSHAGRLHHIAREYKKLLAAHKPKSVAIERLFFTKNTATGISVAEARGVILETSFAYFKNEGRILEFTPQQIKQNITNYGGADKKTVARMAGALLGMDMKNLIDDATDAVAIALTGLNHRKNLDTL
jgi:crossover junction endodeoxyribonuclease RuvC